MGPSSRALLAPLGAEFALSGTSGGAYGVDVLGGFSTRREGQRLELPASAWRLIALLALDRRCVSRAHVAATLQRDRQDARALANVRMMLWRIRQSAPDLIDIRAAGLQLGSAVQVDLDEITHLSRALAEGTVADPTGIQPRLFCQELLPDWCDDFVDIHREIVRQMCLHALENLARELLRRRRASHALDAALTAVAQSPLRESSHQLVIEIHLSEGNQSEARRQFDSLSRMLWRELRIGPSESLRALVNRGGVKPFTPPEHGRR